MPAFDSPSAFGNLLDRGAGSFRLGPYGINVPTARTYVPGTNVLTTTWHTPGGWILVHDALTMGPRQGPDTVTPHTRPPADDDAEHLLVRTVECLEGSVEIELVCEPAFDYGREPAGWTLVDDAGHAADAAGAGQTLRLSTDLSIGIEGSSARARHVLAKGERAFCALSWADGLASPTDVADAAARIDATVRFWRNWLARARIPDHPLRHPLERSALTVKGLTYMPTGATVAALTTSLPETPGGERNWDYRYTWMRDSTFTLQALHYLLLDWEADEFMQFVADVEPTEDGSLQIMYGIDGRRDLTETTRDELSGYEGAHPVRIGNGAFDQRQNDVFGAVLDSILLHTRRSRHLPRRLWPLVRSQAEGAIAAWREPDQGIWEARGKPQHYVSSKLMGWVALDRAAKLAEIRGDRALQQTWAETAEEIRADILAHGVSDRGVLRQHYDTDALDASTLLAPLFGFLPGTDERMKNTVDAISAELSENGFVLRYVTDETDDGLSGKEGTFLICSFWLVSALTIVGEMRRATDLMERLLRIASPLGLYAEEFEVDRARHLGNFPQAFSHLALIEAAARIILADRLEECHGMNGTDPTADRVLVLGGGLAGVACAQKLGDEGIDVVLVDRNDYHQFQPLLYQVASSQLPAEDIARPHRTIFADYPSVDARDRAGVGSRRSPHRSLVLSDGQTLTGSHLVMAAGARPNFFGVPGAAEHAFPLYSVADAERLRLHLQHLLQEAMAGRGAAEPGALDVVVVGGGPTGVETTGALGRADAGAARAPAASTPPGRSPSLIAAPTLLGQFSEQGARLRPGQTHRGRRGRQARGRCHRRPPRPGRVRRRAPPSRRAPWCGAAGNRARRSRRPPGRSSAAADASTSGPT